MQPVDPREVGRVLAEAPEAEPSLAITQFAGPEALSACELARRWRLRTGSHAVSVRLPVTRALRSGGHEPGREARQRDRQVAGDGMTHLGEDFEALRPGLLWLAYGQLGSLAVSEDVVQEAFQMPARPVRTGNRR